MKKTAILFVFILSTLTGLDAQSKTINASPNENSITYHLTHPLHKIESTSKEVISTIRFDPVKRTVESVTASVDVTKFDSGNSNRDSHAMEVIDAISFPEADFSGTSVVTRGDSLFVSGKMNFHGVTHDVVLKALQQWTENSLSIHAALSLSLTEFHIERPALLLVPVEDELRFTITAVYRF